MRPLLKHCLFAPLVWLSAFSVGFGSDRPSPPEMEVLFQQSLATTVVPFQKKREELSANYINKISELKANYQTAGNLSSLKKAEAEIKSMETHGTIGAADFTDATVYRSIFRRESQSIDRQENAAVVALRQRAIETLKSFLTESTKAGDLEAATAYGKQVTVHSQEVAKLLDVAAGKPVLKSFQIMMGAEADAMLARHDPAANKAKAARVEASSSFQGHPATSVIREMRPNSLSEFEKAEFWALNGSTGWLKLSWGSPVRTTTLLLINRPVPSDGDFWVKAEVSLNSQPLAEIANFGRMMLGVIELEGEIELKELEIKINQGTDNPGLSAIEVY